MTGDPTGDRPAEPARGLRLHGLAVGYRNRRRAAAVVLRGLDAVAPRGRLTVLLGPNGTGKSTLLHTVCGLQPPLAGRVLLDGQDTAGLDRRDLARRLAVVLTTPPDPGLLSARELVALGRHPHTGVTGALTRRDREAVAWALAAANAGHLAERPVRELSDGERQRVLTARALAQEPSVLLLDEPTAFLDVPSRVALTGMLARLARDRDLAVVVSTHDLELALRVADTLWLIDRSGGLHAGTPEQLTLGGVVGAVFDDAELAFDVAAGVFTPRDRGVGTVRVTAPEPAASVLARGLARTGWRRAVTGPADIEVTAAGGALATAAGGRRLVHADVTSVLTWAELAAQHRRTGAMSAGATPAGAERRAAPADVAAALADVARAGPYFAVAVGPAGRGGGRGDRAGWRPLADLYRDPAPLAGLVAAVRVRLGTDEDRVAASILYQGLAARLWSPVLAAAVAHRRVPDLAPDETYWRPASGPLPLLAPEPGGWEPGAGDLSGLVHRVVVEQHLVPLAGAVQARTRVAAGLLWGNAASALVGSARALASFRPDLDAAATRLVEALLGRAPLAGTGGFVRPVPGSDARFFLRRSCCLYYRVPGGGLCGDCALRAPAPGAPH